MPLPQYAADPDALRRHISACRACELAGYVPRAHPIAPAQPFDARVMLIGQAPGAITDHKGYHFAGPAGAALERWFERAGFPGGYFRSRVHLSSLTRCFPGKGAGSNGDRPPSRAEIGLCRPFLARELELVQPRLVILVGSLAITEFLGKQPLSATVGRVFDVQQRTYLPLPHASGVSRWLNNPANRALLAQALTELGRLRVALDL
jgi:uracil-DNA glycosylase